MAAFFVEELEAFQKPSSAYRAVIESFLNCEVAAFIAWPFGYILSGDGASKWKLEIGQAIYLQMTNLSNFENLLLLYFKDSQGNFGYNQQALDYWRRLREERTILPLKKAV